MDTKKVWTVQGEMFESKAEAQKRVDEINAKRKAKRERGTKARDTYECNGCKGSIEKGSAYWKQSERIGSSKADTFEDGNIVMHGVTITNRYCKKCASKSGLNK